LPTGTRRTASQSSTQSQRVERATADSFQIQFPPALDRVSLVGIPLTFFFFKNFRNFKNFKKNFKKRNLKKIPKKKKENTGKYDAASKSSNKDIPRGICSTAAPDEHAIKRTSDDPQET
jgi:5-methylcytosine-specific restriction endonuclease McrBC GTP-binding regulatory subunit McrB